MSLPRLGGFLVGFGFVLLLAVAVHRWGVVVLWIVGGAFIGLGAALAWEGVRRPWIR